MCFVRTKKKQFFIFFCHCSKVIPIWQNIESWISNKVGIKLRITDSMKILGYIERNKDYWPINFVILVTKKIYLLVFKKGLHVKHLLFTKRNKKDF